MAKKSHKIGRIVGWSLGALLLLIVSLPLALYIPWVQNVVKEYACKRASQETGLDITIDRLLIKFPLDISVDGLLVIDEQRDTMVQAGNFTASIAVKPLFDLEVNVDEARLTNGLYRMVAEDSSMVLKAKVQHCGIKGIALDIDHNSLNLDNATLRGGNVTLDMYPYKSVTECDSTESKPWKIKANCLRLEDVDYAMTMLPTIDSMAVHVGSATLINGLVDTGARLVNARSLAIDSTSVHYTHLSDKDIKAYNATHPLPVDSVCNPADTAQWTVRADSLRLTGASAVYALRGAKLRKGRGLDMDYIDVDRLNIAIDKFYNHGTDVTLALRNLKLTENGSALELTQGSGDIALNSELVSLEKVKLTTLFSDINLDAHIDLSIVDNPKQGNIYINTDSRIALQDVSHLVPELSPMLSTIPQVAPLALKANVRGNMLKVDIENFTADLPRYAHASVKGSLTNPTDFNQMVGALDINARFDNINFVKPTLLDKAMQKQVNFPPMNLTAHAKLNRGSVTGDAVMALATGKLVGQGSFNSRNNAYSLDASFSNFPLHAIAPLANADNLTASMHFSGQGFDFTNPATSVNAQFNLVSVYYYNELYSNLDTHLVMSDGILQGSIISDNDNCRVNIDLSGTMDKRHYIVDAVGNVDDLDLNVLGWYDGECCGHGRLVGSFDIDLDEKIYDAKLNIEDFEWRLDGDLLKAGIASATFKSDVDYTTATFDNEDNHLDFTAAHGLDSLINHFTRSGNIAMDQFKRRSINIDTLQAALPTFKMCVKMGTDGLVQRYVQKYGIDFREIDLDMSNDSNIFVDGHVHSLSMDGTNIDTLTLKATQWRKYLAFQAHMGNRPGTMDEFAQVTVRGGIKGATLDFLATQQNINKEIGYRVGCNATLTDTAVNMKMFPQEPIIGYRKWVMNEDNFINFNYGTRMLDANLKLESDSSMVSLLTQRVPGATKENILLNIDNLRIEEWTKFIPNIDPMSGVLDAHMDVAFDGHALEGKGVLDLQNFMYNGMREGNFTVNTDYALDPATGGTRINANMMVDGSQVAIALGSINETDTINPLNMHMKLDRFPLSKASAFIPGRIVRLRGYLNGEIQLAGSADNPLLNGYVVGDSASVVLPKYGCTLQLCNDRLSVNDNVLKFDNYRIMGLNNNAVAINGEVNMKNLDNMMIDLSLKGKNVQFIGSDQRGFSEVFGKAFADVSATVTGRSNYMSVRADLALLSGSNITYVLQDEVSNLTNAVDKKMVTFVNLSDANGGIPTLMTANGNYSTNIVANIEVQQGAKINAYLTTDGKDRATIDGSGRFRYSIDFAGKDVFSGTYTIESGNVRYSPPLISQKNFDIVSGSNVVWTGEMLNPQLNIEAIEHVKTSVSQGDQGSKLVDFLIQAKVGGTLNSIKLDFDMRTESDMAVINELQSMSDVQRSQAAINMLLYNTYSGTNSAGNLNGLTASTALFSFLQSQLNSWAAKALKGVDLSFGINQYEGKKGKGTETSYSYRLSKNLFNDRFKIVVGGEYSTDASAEENFAQNLISDISFEYMLNSTGSRYVRLFRHSGFESVLEGQITEAGVGFVMKRKVESLKDMFRRTPLKAAVRDTLRRDDELDNDSITKE